MTVTSSRVPGPRQRRHLHLKCPGPPACRRGPASLSPESTENTQNSFIESRCSDNRGSLVFCLAVMAPSESRRTIEVPSAPSPGMSLTAPKARVQNMPWAEHHGRALAGLGPPRCPPGRPPAGRARPGGESQFGPGPESRVGLGRASSTGTSLLIWRSFDRPGTEAQSSLSDDGPSPLPVPPPAAAAALSPAQASRGPGGSAALFGTSIQAAGCTRQPRMTRDCTRQQLRSLSCWRVH